MSGSNRGGDWETVTGKSKKNKSNNKDENGAGKLNKIKENRVIQVNLPKIEEILSNQQLKQLYSTNDYKKQQQFAAQKLNDLKKQQQQQQQGNLKADKINQKNQQQKQQNQPAKKHFKNIDEAFKQFNFNALETLINNTRYNFPDSHLVWLKAITTYINSNIHVDVSNDPIFNGKSEQYPTRLLPAQLRSFIYGILSESGRNTITYFFDQSLTSLAVEMSKGEQCIGHKIMIQLIAIEWPNVCCENLAKNSLLLNSYINRRPIGLSLLWAIGQGGYYDLAVGLRVWKNIMFPVIGFKSYSKFIIEYLHRITTINVNESKNLAFNLSVDEFFKIFNNSIMDGDDYCGDDKDTDRFQEQYRLRNSLNTEYIDLLDETALSILNAFIEKSPCTTLIFTMLLNKYHGNNPIITNGLLACLEKDSDCFNFWRKYFKKNHIQTSNLLRLVSYIFKDLKIQNEMKMFLRDLNISVNAETAVLIQTITDKETTVKKGSKTGGSSTSGCCSGGSHCWLLILAIFITIAAIVGVLTYDTNTNGNGVFAKSATGRFLERIGALPYVEWTWEKSMSRGARIYKWVIPYVKIGSETLTPYLEFLRDFFKMMLNGIKLSAIGLCEYVDKKLPIVGAYIDQYSPGLSTKIADGFISLRGAICHTFGLIRTNITDFFTTTVFVGKLSPENLGKALNETEYTVLRYLRWFNERVDFYAKIQ